MKQPSEITATAIYRVIGQPCWGVPSDDTSRTLPYKVCFDETSCNWTCECERGLRRADKGLSANCKHVRAVFVSITANKEAAAERKPEVAPLAERGSLNRQPRMIDGIPMR